MSGWWLMWIPGPGRVRFIRAEPPCGKGEWQVGRLVFGWQRENTA
jgi:hypothetical protein